MATRSLTLLENNGILPLGGKPRVAVVGPTDDPLALLSGYSFPVHLIISDMVDETSQVTTRARRWSTIWARRTCVMPKDVTSSKNEWRARRSSRVTAGQTDAAVAGVAKYRADPRSRERRAGERRGGGLRRRPRRFVPERHGRGRIRYRFPEPAASATAAGSPVATGKPVIVVMTGGRPYNLQGLEDKVAALMMAGRRAGRGWAIADVLTGRAEPQGRLVVSVPKVRAPCRTTTTTS